ncbi:unnamed protein product [Staurois parvus]|uniref:Uncharacterized protein n=1 Tax=Staurois parvus TaxID=386267 RepID=A0ABN9B9X6_9NEOB|nr:unnamed protein product [Staurois parvus]
MPNPNISQLRVHESDFSRSAGKSVPAESSAISDSSLTVPSHVQRLKHCIYLFPFRIQMFLFGNRYNVSTAVNVKELSENCQK